MQCELVLECLPQSQCSVSWFWGVQEAEEHPSYAPNNRHSEFKVALFTVVAPYSTSPASRTHAAKSLPNRRGGLARHEISPVTPLCYPGVRLHAMPQCAPVLHRPTKLPSVCLVPAFTEVPAISCAGRRPLHPSERAQSQAPLHPSERAQSQAPLHPSERVQSHACQDRLTDCVV